MTATSDFRVHEAVRTKTDQHEPLLQSLRAYGWRDARLHVLVVGHTGVMRTTNAAILQDLGIPNQGVTPLLRKVAVQTLYRSCGVLNQYSGSRWARQTAAEHLEPSLATYSPQMQMAVGCLIRVRDKLNWPCRQLNKVVWVADYPIAASQLDLEGCLKHWTIHAPSAQSLP